MRHLEALLGTSHADDQHGWNVWVVAPRHAARLLASAIEGRLLETVDDEASLEACAEERVEWAEEIRLLLRLSRDGDSVCPLFMQVASGLDRVGQRPGIDVTFRDEPPTAAVERGMRHREHDRGGRLEDACESAEEGADLRHVHEHHAGDGGIELRFAERE